MLRPVDAGRAFSALLALGVALGLPAGGLLAPRPAAAWADAAVRSVRARVAVAPDGRARVELEADVRVYGGWLEGIELAGFDPDLVLDPSARPWARDANGQSYAPAVSVVSEGRVAIAFPGHSPRRGLVTIGLAYHTTLAHRATTPIEGADRVRVRWTLPGWRAGLDGVSIELLAPRGAEPARDAPGDEANAAHELDVEATTEVEPADEGSLVRWRRAHLPRTVPWTVAVDVPADAMAEALRGVPVLAPPPSPRDERAMTPPDTRPFFVVVAALLVVIALLKTTVVARHARRSRSVARPLVPGPLAVRVVLAALSGIGLALLGPTTLTLGEDAPSIASAAAPWIAIGLGALTVSTATFFAASAPAPSQLGAWRTADARWLRRADPGLLRRALDPRALLDLTTPLGALHALAWLALPWVDLSFTRDVPFEARLLIGVLPIAALASGTPRAFPTGPADALARLLSFARGLRALPAGAGLCPALHVDVRGEVQDARLRVALAHRPEGLLRCDLALSELPHAGGWDAHVVLLVVTRAQSEADAALAAAMPDVVAVPSRGGRRILRTLPVERRALPALERVIAALAAVKPAAPASRGAATRGETVRDLPAPHAVGM